MINKILDQLSDTGIIIGFLVGILKAMRDIKNRSFSFVTAFADIVSSVIMGYIAFQIVGGSELDNWLKIVWTVFVSANVFVILSVIQDKELLDQLIRKLLKNPPN